MTKRRVSIYAEAVEAKKLVAALEMRGLDTEIAILRVRFAELLKAGPEMYAPMLRCAGLIVRSVAAQHKMSPQDTEEFVQNFERTVRSYDRVLPEHFYNDV